MLNRLHGYKNECKTSQFQIFLIFIKLYFKATRPVMDLKAFPKDNMLWVEWTAPNESVNKYVLEWCILSDKSPCIPDWQQEDGNVHRTYLRGIPNLTHLN